MKTNKFISIILSFSIVLSVMLPVLCSFANGNEIFIYNEDDFISFAKKCKTDTWSKDKIINLCSDIEISKEFDCVPTFSGIFNGNNHTINFNEIIKKGSYVGVFRYIQSGGVVADTIFRGNITPSGSQKNIGGIVGNNKGTLKNCTFNGNVVGETNIGGICGYVSETGKIENCKFDGSVTGIHYTGGICGQNYGTVSGCTNTGSVNTTNTEKKKNFEDINIDIDNINSTETVNTTTDTGGICGFTKGTISNCINKGNVGYKSLGYNTGGICGRQAGYIFNCQNYGTINGRKDIGGIVGQAEPYILLQYSNDVIKEINSILSRMNNVLKNNALLSGNEFDETLDNINDKLTEVTDTADIISDDAEDYADEITKQLNTLTKNINNSLDDLNDISVDISDILEKLIDASAHLNDGGLSLKSSIKKANEAVKSLQNAKDEISDAISLIKEGLDFTTASTFLDAIDKAETYIKKAKSNITEAIDEANDVLPGLKSALSSASNAVSNTNSAISLLTQSLDSINDIHNKISNILDTFIKNNTFSVPSASDYFGNDFDNLSSSVKSMKDEFKTLKDKIKDKKSKVSNDVDKLTGEIDLLVDALNDAYKDTVQAEKEDYYEDVSDSDNIADTRGKVDKSTNNGEVYGDINVGGILGSMAIEYDFDPEDDIKKEASKSLKFTYRTKAVARRCKNNGVISSSSDYCGGIVGRMDLGSVLSCENYGDITSNDGDYIGGIAGKSETIIRNCASKCDLSGNNYIGGIVGEGETITGCLSCINVSKYEECAGSIAGYAENDKVNSNYFVYNNVGGIDDINYTGIASTIGIDKFTQSVKEIFGTSVTFTLKFVADDKVVAELPFEYMKPIQSSSIPKVPSKSGYYGKWSDYNFNKPTYNATITAEYSRDIELIQSKTKRNSKSVILVCGPFDDTAEVSASKINKNPDEFQNAYDSYKVEIIGTHGENYKVRYLPLSDSSVDIYLKYNNQITKVSTTDCGSYLEFESPVESFELYEVEKSYLWLYILIGVVLLLVVIFIIKKRKNK